MWTWPYVYQCWRKIQGVGDLKVTTDQVENVTGVVDLRRQRRSSDQRLPGQPEATNGSVYAYTRDGIELGTNISALFTIGQDMTTAPNVLQVTYEDAQRPENLRVIAIEDRNGSALLRSISNELDPDDRGEIHKYYQSRI